MEELIAGLVKSGMAEAGAKSADLWMVPINEIHTIDGFNVRTPGPDLEAHITWLQGQITTRGYDKHKPLAGYVALEGRKNIIYVYDGHCRLEAAKRAVAAGLTLEVLPVVISPKGTNMGDLVVALASGNGGKQLEPYEKGLVCKKLIALNWEESQIAEQLGMTRAYINDLLSLVAAPAAVQKLVKTGAVSATNAIKAVKKHGSEAGKALQEGAEKAASRGKTRATAQDLESPKAAVVGLSKAVLNLDEAYPNVELPEGFGDCWRAIVEMAKA